MCSSLMQIRIVTLPITQINKSLTKCFIHVHSHEYSSRSRWKISIESALVVYFKSYKYIKKLYLQ